MPFESTPGLAFTRASLQNELGVPVDERGGDWSTGYTSFQGEYFVFCNIGVPGRTGHDYDNHWEGDTLVWRAKGGTNIRQPQIARMTDGAQRVHVFYRYADRSAFLYAGLGRPNQVLDTEPVTVRWRFDEHLANPELTLAVANAGFIIEQVGVHTLRATLGDLVIYIKRSTTSFPLVIHPAWEERMTELKAAGGMRPGKRFYYHNSTMRRFPQRRHGGQGDIPYGLDFGFTNDEALRSFLGLLKGEAPDTGAAEEFPDVDPRTETEVTRAARLGQQQFRRDLLNKYQGRCVLTGINC
jgi:putative restriction endonuclease